MKKSVKVFFTALLVGFVVSLTSCAAIMSAMMEATVMYDRSYKADLLEVYSTTLTFRSTQNHGGNYDLEVNCSYGGISKTSYDYQWMLDTSNVDGEKKNILIYENGVVKGTLIPDSLAPTKLTVAENFDLNVNGTTVPFIKYIELDLVN